MRTAVSLLAAGLLLSGTPAAAQQPVRTLQFTKPAEPPEFTIPPAPGLVQSAGTQDMQPRPPALRASDDASQYYQIQLEPPGPQRLFRLESEAALQERMRQEARERPSGDRIQFPDEPILSREVYTGRSWPPFREFAAPNYVCYRPLLFEQKNAERYGWDLGIVAPFVSTAAFYWDVVTLPYHLFTAPCRKFECSAGYCLPGDPVPYLLYPPEWSLTGLAAQAGTVGLLFAVIP